MNRYRRDAIAKPNADKQKSARWNQPSKSPTVPLSHICLASEEPKGNI